MTLLAEDLFVLSDVLQMELRVSATGVVTGDMQVAASIPDIGLRLNMRPQVVSSAYDPVNKSAALVVHVHGDLYVYAAHDRTANLITVIVLDQAKMSSRLKGVLERANAAIERSTQFFTKHGLSISTRSPYGETWAHKKAA